MLQPVSGILLVLGASAVSADLLDSTPKETAIHVECHGKMRHGVVAIGGETTGTTITFDGMTWELKFPDEASRTFAKEQHKKPMTVVGSLRQVRGKAIPLRWIVDVDRMSPRDAAALPECANVTVQGTLQTRAATAGVPPGMVIEAAGITWPLDLSAERSLHAKAESMVGKPAVLEGRLERGSDAKSPPQPILRVKKLDAPTAITVKK